MPIKLTYAHPLYGPGINRNTIKEMVTAYRLEHKSDPHCLKFVHFNLKEVIQLFIDNKALDLSLPISDQLDDLQYWGLKIYLGYHTNLDNCPDDPGYPDNRYLYMDTAIFCNTRLNAETTTWEDQLAPDSTGADHTSTNNFVSILGAGEGGDRGAICPPNCPPVPDFASYKHQDIVP